MNVVIVDDEILERKAMAKFLEESFQTIKVIGEAATGRKAIELAEKLSPDFMIMDIKMPGIDGLDAIKQIRQINPSIKFIMVSAYDSFEYAKTAMKEGVKEYILKPAAKKETVEAVLRLCKEIEEERKEREKALTVTKEHFLLKLIQFEGEEKLFRELFPKAAVGFFYVIETMDRNKTYDQAKKMLAEAPAFSTITYELNHQLISLCISEEKENRARPEALSLARKLHLAYEGELFVGIGQLYDNARDFPKSYQEGLKAVHFLKKEAKVGYGFAPDQLKQSNRLENEWLEAVNRGEIVQAKQYFSMLREENGEIELYIKARQFLEQKGIDISDFHFSEPFDWDEFLRVSCYRMQEIHRSNDPIERAKKYIQEHYNEQITLEEVAEFSGLSPTYFTKLFKEASGKTFIDFLTDLRLTKAKELIEKNEHHLKEISYMVGYKDPNYFSRVFKKQFQMSPKQFQKQILKK